MNQSPMNIKVAISTFLLDAYARIPRAQQAEVIRFFEKLKYNPTSPGINFEKIRDAKDPYLYSVRINDNYRGIISKPEKGNIYLLLWVDKHDDAYQWARNRTCKVNSETGSIQVYEVTEPETPPPPAETPDHRIPGLFDAFNDRQLLKLGVPQEFLSVVRQIESEEQLENVDKELPTEAYEALYMLAAGYREDEVYNELFPSPAEFAVDTGDYNAALENNYSRSRFYVVDPDNEAELQEILNASLEKWRVFLHPTQARLVERDWNGPVRVLGGAGTGKTVAALHRAKWLAENRFNQPNDRILFTTFTKNLAADIRENLKKICAPGVLKRIEVVNLDQWVSNYLRRQDYPFEIHYRTLSDKLWIGAMAYKPNNLDLPDTFYAEEWEKVIQPNGVTTLAQYFQVSRSGRGTRISRKMKKDIWVVFEEYRNLLDENKKKERTDALRDAAADIKEKQIPLPYRALIVDEAQDMGPQAFQLIRAIIPEQQQNDLFIVGDPHQRIYKAKATLCKCGINIKGRGRRLRINYRTTEENRKWAVSILEGTTLDDLDDGVDHQNGYRSLLHGEPPKIKGFDSMEDEIDYIKNNYLDRLRRESWESGNEKEFKLRDICLAFRTNELRDRYYNILQESGLDVYKIKRSEPENRSIDGLRLATMHRVKGLEFDHIILPGLTPDSFTPQTNLRSEDPVIQAENRQLERALLYVAATRARKTVLVTYHGRPPKILDND